MATLNSKAWSDQQMVDYIEANRHKPMDDYILTLARLGYNFDFCKEYQSYQSCQAEYDITSIELEQESTTDTQNFVMATTVASAVVIGFVYLAAEHLAPELTTTLSVVSAGAAGYFTKTRLDILRKYHSESELKTLKENKKSYDAELSSNASIALQSLHLKSPALLLDNPEAVFFAEEIILSKIDQRRNSVLIP